jgi:transposase
VVARIARRLLARCQELTTQINELERELRDLVRMLAPSLLEIPGCGVLSAAVIVGETAGVHRFRDKDAYARFTARRQYRCGRARAEARSDSTAVATARSTAPCT